MKKLIYLCCILISNITFSQIFCTDGNFEGSLNNFQFQTIQDWNSADCNNTNFNNFSNTNAITNNYFSPVSITSNGFNNIYDATLLNFNVNLPRVRNGIRSLKLNPRNVVSNETKTATVLKKPLGNISQNYVVLDYAAVFHKPNHPGSQPFFRMEIINNFTGNVELSQCINTDSPGLIDANPNGNNFTKWYYSNWSTVSLNVSDYMGQSNLSLRLTVSDCDEGAHDAITYVDDICFSNTPVGTVYNPTPTSNTNITLNNIRPFCYPETFNVRGNINSTNQGPVMVQLCFTEITGGLSGPQCVLQQSVTGNSFSFLNVDLNTIPGFTFNPNNPYTVTASIVGDNTLSNPVNLNYNDCDDDCPVFNPSTITISEFIMSWPDTYEGNYILEFISSDDCPYGSSVDTGQAQEFLVSGNSFDVRDAFDAIGSKCLEFSIRTDCTDERQTCIIRAASGLDPQNSPSVIVDNCNVTYNRVANEVLLFPNPTKDILNVKANTSIKQLTLSNIYGKTLKTINNVKTTNIQLNLSQFKKGYYILKITTEDNEVTFKKVILE